MMLTLAFIEGLGSPLHWIILLVVALLIFGRRLPEVGRSLGKGITEFKKGLKDATEEVQTGMNAPAPTQLPMAGPQNPYGQPAQQLPYQQPYQQGSQPIPQQQPQQYPQGGYAQPGGYQQGYPQPGQPPMPPQVQTPRQDVRVTRNEMID